MNIAERVRGGAAMRRSVVRYLGPFRVQDPSGNPPQLRTRKARALLAALAVSGRPMSRDSLAALLWSDRGEAQARASLRQTVFELQHWGGDEPVLVAGRDDLSRRADLLVTDLELIREAAVEGDWQRLLVQLRHGEPGLLTDLDGLDEEFDTWLRGERAHEPAATLAVAVEAAERCAEVAGPKAALEIALEVLRLDPVNEPAARLAMRIDKQLGDNAALHRHFNALTERLRDELDTVPAAQTVALFNRLSGGSFDEPGQGAGEEPKRAVAESPGRISRRGLLIAVAAMLLFGAALVAVFLSRENVGPARGRPLLLAVLPFEQQSSGDAWLAEGLWDDTRAALSRNPAIRVLGRATTNATVQRKLSPRDYRRRLGVAYILEGVVRRSGDEVLVLTSLTRTSDGVAIWEDSFRARLGDPFALQEAIAGGIEGKLRGRLAAGGGRRADQISTTPAVYALYSEARSLVRERDRESARRAQLLVRKALTLDPNYAPAWTVLAETMHFADYGAVAVAERREQARSYARRALALAPRLAQAHATYGFFLGDGSPVAERELQTAVALDPNHVEAWLWLGNLRFGHLQFREAAAAYEQAVAIDPLWDPAVSNLLDVYSELGDQKAIDRLMSNVRDAGGDEDILLSLRIRNATLKGDLTAVAAPVRAISAKGRADWSTYETGLALLALGYADEGGRLLGYPEYFGPVVRCERLPPASETRGRAGASNFWERREFGAYASRAIMKLGQDRELLRIYHDAFPSLDSAIDVLSDNATLQLFAPTLAVAMQRSGQSEDAARLLDAASKLLESAAAPRSITSRRAAWALARVRAAQGQYDDAIRLAEKAVAFGWMPDGLEHAVDIALDPAFDGMHADRRFLALRKRILDRVGRERAELGPIPA